MIIGRVPRSRRAETPSRGTFGPTNPGSPPPAPDAPARTFSTHDLVDRFEWSQPRFQLDVYVAQYAELLRESPWTDRIDLTLDDLAYDVLTLDDLFPRDDDVQEFIDLVGRATDS